jgi:hypothetical protein
MESLSLEEAIELLKGELRKLGPLIDLDVFRKQQDVEDWLPVTVNGREPGCQGWGPYRPGNGATKLSTAVVSDTNSSPFPT